jgi:hypothetical protein
MGLLQRRTKLGKLVKDAGDAHLPAALGSALSGVRVRPPKAVTSGLGAVAALTAGSAAISALRRRSEESRDDR